MNYKQSFPKDEQEEKKEYIVLFVDAWHSTQF